MRQPSARQPVPHLSGDLDAQLERRVKVSLEINEWAVVLRPEAARRRLSTGSWLVHRSEGRLFPGPRLRRRSSCAHRSAARARRPDLGQLGGVADRRQLHELGIGPGEVAAQVAAGRWRLCGCAIVLHNTRLTREQRWTAALVNFGPRSVLTSFTAAHAHGLRGWDQDEVHVLAPAGTKMARVDEFGIRLHLAGDWSRVRQIQPRRLHDLAQATVLAASSFGEPRSASGLLAATVQQRLLRTGALAQALDEAPRLRHRAAMVHAVADIEQGAQALSEIDFVRLCRRNRLPKPTHQAVRRDASGRRRYLDASWTLPGDRIVAVEVDGALHLNVRTWRNDQLRQNELVLDGMLLLRYPSDVVRYEQHLVVAQLRRALGVTAPSAARASTRS